MSTVGDPNPTYEWNYQEKDVLTPQDFLREILDKLGKKEIVSVGEYHDERKDTSLDWISAHQNEIFYAYDLYREFNAMGYSKATPIPFERLLPDDSLIRKLNSLDLSFNQLAKMHVGRLFALAVLPLAKTKGYTDLILEGLDESDARRTFDLSKDRIGELLNLTMAMRLGVNIHGAYGHGTFATGVDIGNALFEKIVETKDEDKRAKILVYNGAAHNMTQPFSGKYRINPIQEIDLSQLSYAPRAIAKYGNKYGAIDLLNGDRLMPESHFRRMQEQAHSTGITRYTHGIDQQTYIIK